MKQQTMCNWQWAMGNRQYAISKKNKEITNCKIRSIKIHAIRIIRKN